MGRAVGRRVRQSAGFRKLRQTIVEGEALELTEVDEEIVLREGWLEELGGDEVLHGVAKGEGRPCGKRVVVVDRDVLTDRSELPGRILEIWERGEH